MKTLTVNDKDYAKAIKLLIENGIQTEPESEVTIPLLRESNAKSGETTAAFGGIWVNDERTMASIRAKAWSKRRYSCAILTCGTNRDTTYQSGRNW